MGPADHPVHIGGESHVLTELKVNPEIKKIPGKRGRRRKDETEEMIRAKQEALLQSTQYQFMFYCAYQRIVLM